MSPVSRPPQAPLKFTPSQLWPQPAATALVALVALLALVVLGGCASAPDVQTEADGATDFTQYRTFAFASPMGTERSGQPTVVTEHLQQAARREMQPAIDAAVAAAFARVPQAPREAGM